MKQPPAETSATDTIQTVSRGLHVLRAFKSERTPLSNAELVNRTGLSKATVSRLTSTLVQMGFLSQVTDGRRFELATGPLGMGHAFIAQSVLLKTVQPFMRELADRVGASTALAVPDGLDMLCIAYHAAIRVTTLRLGPGSVLPMGMTAIGRAYLWALPQAEQLPLIAQIKQHTEPAQFGELERGLCESFAELDGLGTCCVTNGYLRDTFGIALPVRLGRQSMLMSLSCGNAVVRPHLATDRKRIGPILKAAAIQLQELLADESGQP